MRVKYGRVMVVLAAAFMALARTDAAPSGDAQVTTETTQKVLEQAHLLMQARNTMIADNISWTNQYLNATDEQLTAFRRDYCEAILAYKVGVADESYRRMFDSEQKFWESMTAHDMRQFFVLGRLDSLAGILRPERPRWALQLRSFAFLERTGPTGMRQDMLAVLAASIGRPASLEIVRILREQKGMPAEERDRLVGILREIEHDATDILLASKIVSASPEPPIPETERDGLDLSFALLPIAPYPGYEGHSPKAFMRLRENAVVADPKYSTDDWQSEESVDRMYQRQAKLGDFAFSKSKLLVGSNRAAVLKSPLWAGTFTAQDLSPDHLGPTPEIDPRQSPLVLMETATGDLGLVQILPEFNGEIPVAYVVTPPNRAVSLSSIPSLLSFVMDSRQHRPYGEIRARRSYVSARGSWWFDGYKNATTSLCDLLTPDSDVSPEDKVQAIRLLGELRSVESAETLVRLIADDQPQNLQNAAEAALARMMPQARYAFKTRLKPAAGPSRERLLKVFRRLEGDEVAEFLLDLWAKEDAK